MDQPLPEDMIGAIKIKDGLFIGDSFAAQVSLNFVYNFNVGLRIRCSKQGNAHHQLCWKVNLKSL